ncbi:MAG: hypothetical protein GY710_09445 [Desulfobacteraceae bacterium]|nr:hypothetical protein [Desulfobacteraceae bacterium]
MEGSDCNTQEQFLFECKARDKLKNLNIAKVLGRIYNIAELRNVAEVTGVSNVQKKIEGLGVNKRYSLAEIISKQSSPKRIGETLSKIDHDFYFPFVSYLGFPNSRIFQSPKSLLSKLKEKNISLENSYTQIFNGLTEPASRSLKIESVKYYETENIVSILASCTRVIISPNSKSTAYENCFVCRIPTIIKFLFDRQLVELSLPYFYEPLAGAMKVEGSHPARFQEIFNQLISRISNMTNESLCGINFDNVVLHLESNCGATDMGWQIEPQESASFDLKQNVIPLKQIFESFTDTLKVECDAYGIKNPLEKVQLYEIFRALKEQGYTYQMVQRVPLGDRGGKVLISLLNGDRNSTPPIFHLSDRGYSIIQKIRMEVWKSQQVKINNPYTISNLLPKSTAKISPPDVPYDKIGVEQTECNAIVSAITEILTEQPDKSLTIQKVSNATRIIGESIKKVFYYLLLDGYLKSTYIAYHVKCNKPISLMQNSILELNETNNLCVHCNHDIEEDEIENRIFFWGKDANVK